MDKIKYILINIVFLLIYIMPFTFLNGKSSILVNFVFISLYLCLILISLLKSNFSFSKSGIILMIVILLIMIVQKSINPIRITALFAGYSIVKYSEDKRLISNWTILFSVIGVIVYSCLYWGFLNRFAYIGFKDPNYSSFAIFLLAVILFYRNKKLGILLFLFGILSFSKSYMLALIIFTFFKFFIPIRKKSFINNLRLNNLLFITTYSIIIMLCMSYIFIYFYEAGNIQNYATGGFSRFYTIIDGSNLKRFLTNTNVLQIFYNDPKFILTGISDATFLELNHELLTDFGLDTEPTFPHNFFFNQLRQYGVFIIFILLYLNLLFKRVINKCNLHVFLAIFFYGVFLGVGFSSYWLILSLIAMKSINNSSGYIETKEIIYNDIEEKLI